MATGSEKKVMSKDEIEWQLANMRLLNQGDPRIKSHTAALETASHLESLLAVAVGAINSILRADVRWRSQNELMFNKQQAERESIASLLKITGLTEQDFAALGIGD